MQNLTAKKTRGKRRRFDGLIEALLKDWQVWKANNGKWRSVCPLHRGADNPSSFRINASGLWKCFSCNASGEIEHLVMKLQHVTYKQALDMLDKAPGVRHRMLDVPELPPFKERFGKQPGYDVLPEANIVLFSEGCPNLLLTRGFSRGALHYYEIGYDAERHRITIPVRDYEGRLVGITYRADFPGSLTSRGREIKYWHDHFDKGEHLWGFHKYFKKRVNRLHLVEGQLDVVRLYQLGLPACAIMGSHLDRRQRDLLVKHARCKELVLMYDNDDAGRSATKQSIKALSKTRFNRNLLIANYTTEDPGDLTDCSQVRYNHWTKALMKGN